MLKEDKHNLRKGIIVMKKAIKILALACAAAMTFTACSNSDNQAEQTYSEAEETVQTKEND